MMIGNPRLKMVFTLLVTSTWANACGSGPGGGDVRTDDINETELFESVSFFCDGEAAITDWLVVAEALTTTDAIDVEVEFFQSGIAYGPIELSEVRPGEWYGEEWEDVLGVDCDGPDIGATFSVIGDGGRRESLDL